MRYVVWIFVISFRVVPSSAQSEPIGLVTHVNGPVERYRQEMLSPVYESDLVYEGDSLVIPLNTNAVVLFKTGIRITCEHSLRFAGVQGTPNSAIEKILNTAQTVHDWLPNAVGRLRHRSDASRSLDPIYPRNTALREIPDSLKWTGTPRRPFTVSVRCYQNDFRLDDTVETLSLALVSSDLEAGRQYHWTVAYWDDINPPASVWFRILTASEVSSLESEETDLQKLFENDTASTAYRLLSVKLKMAYGLHSDADAVLRSLASTSEKNPGYWQLKAHLQDILDYPSDALTSLKQSAIRR